MKKPKVSVILPTFNRAYIIKRAVDSVLNQSFKDFELIIIDDASTDNTLDVIKKYKDNRIVYIKRKINSNIAKENARNDGLRIAGGKYIAYVDSDNSWLKNHLKVLNEFLEENKKFDVVFCDSWVWRNGMKSIERSFDFHKSMVIPFPFIDTGEIMHKKSCMNKVGLWKYDGYKRDDWDFFVRLSKNYNTKHIKNTLCNCYYSDQLYNAKFFLNKGINNLRVNKRFTQICIEYLKYSIECCRKCTPDQKTRAKKIESAAKTLLVFKNKNEAFSLL